MENSILRYLLLLLVLPLLVVLFPNNTSAWTGNPPPANLPSGIDPIAIYNTFDTDDLTENDSFFVYKQGSNPDRYYMLVAKAPNKIRIGSASDQSFVSSTSGTWERFYINQSGTKSILWADWTSAEFDVTDYYMAYNIEYDNYTGTSFVPYVWPTPEPPEPEPEPELQSEKYYVRFGQQVGFVISILIGIYTIWILRYRK